MSVLLFGGEDGFDLKNAEGGEIAWGTAVCQEEFSLVQGLDEYWREICIAQAQFF